MLLQTIILSLCALLIGTAFAVQGSINAELGRAVGSSLVAAAISFLVGSVVLLAAMLALGAQPAVPLRQLPPWLWIAGGVLGAFIVFSTVLLVPKIGIAAVSALFIAGQLTAAAFLDHYGLLGTPEHPMNALRALGIMLLLSGAVLVRYA